MARTRCARLLSAWITAEVAAPPNISNCLSAFVSQAEPEKHDGAEFHDQGLRERPDLLQPLFDPPHIGAGIEERENASRMFESDVGLLLGCHIVPADLEDSDMAVRPQLQSSSG